ncbi:MAG: hypothetical protein MUO21_08590 [Nitrososphaeraceae archaeon]|nr:hypothetical protein [Nitrososphaeraceae archaeon]
MQGYNWGQMMVRYAAGGDIKGVREALNSGSSSVGSYVGESYWVAAGKDHRSIMILLESKYIIPDKDLTTARNRAKAFGHTDCVQQVDNYLTK